MVKIAYFVGEHGQKEWNRCSDTTARYCKVLVEARRGENDRDVRESLIRYVDSGDMWKTKDAQV